MGNTLYGEKAMYLVAQKHPVPIVEPVHLVAELDRLDALVRRQDGTLSKVLICRLYEAAPTFVNVAF